MSSGILLHLNKDISIVEKQIDCILKQSLKPHHVFIIDTAIGNKGFNYAKSLLNISSDNGCEYDGIKFSGGITTNQYHRLVSIAIKFLLNNTDILFIMNNRSIIRNDKLSRTNTALINNPWAKSVISDVECGDKAIYYAGDSHEYISSCVPCIVRDRFSKISINEIITPQELCQSIVSSIIKEKQYYHIPDTLDFYV